MKLIAKKCFPKAILSNRSSQCTKLALEALQEIRIKHRWEAMDKENQSILKAKTQNNHIPQLLINGDTKQLLARIAIYFINPDKMDQQPRKKSEVII
jgi:hypothetical protein